MSLLSELGTVNLLILSVFAVIGVFVLLKIAHHFYKALVTGVFFSAIPFAASYMGYGMSTEPVSIVSFMLLGISIYLTTHTMHIGMKAAKVIMGPFNRFFQEKDIRHRKIQRARHSGND